MNRDELQRSEDLLTVSATGGRMLHSRHMRTRKLKHETCLSFLTTYEDVFRPHFPANSEASHQLPQQLRCMLKRLARNVSRRHRQGPIGREGFTHGSSPYLSSRAAARSSGFTSPFHFQMAKIGG